MPYLFIKLAVDDGVPPAFLAWVRIVLGAAVLLGLAWRAGTLASLRGSTAMSSTTGSSEAGSYDGTAASTPSAASRRHPRPGHDRVLACGPGDVLSHRAAAALWGLIRWPTTLEVIARSDHRLPGVHTHRSRRLDDVTTHYGIPTTTPARTLLDLAEIRDPASLTRAVSHARLRAAA